MTIDPRLDYSDYDQHMDFDPLARSAEARDRADAEPGNCYQAAYSSIDTNEIGELVHGVVTGQGPIAGVRMAHAWVEIGDLVFDTSTGVPVVMRREGYYELGEVRAEQCRRYTPAEARAHALRTRHFGPWHADAEGAFADE
jgi:hypothetical protein